MGKSWESEVQQINRKGPAHTLAHSQTQQKCYLHGLWHWVGQREKIGSRCGRAGEVHRGAGLEGPESENFEFPIQIRNNFETTSFASRPGLRK